MNDPFVSDGLPAEPRPGRDGKFKKPGMMVSPKMAANSLSLAIFAMRVSDAAFQHPTDFVEVEVDGEFIGAAPVPTAPETPALARARAELGQMYLRYESIAESLGPETKDIFKRFCAITDSENLPRLAVADYKL